jgi:tetratricopeptide (TPR) repeat protein
MDKSAKLYKKAMEKYRNGYIDDAIDACEKSISSNIKNSAAINLKGLLLYIKGELDNARNLWMLNKDVNKDSVSKKYIESSTKDEEKLQLYETALGLMKEIKINEALNTLEICSESDFNSINVRNAISECLIKQGEYNSAIEQINKVLELDKKDKIAMENKKMLMQYGIIKKKISYGKLLRGVLSTVLFLGILGFAIVNRGKILEGAKKVIPKDDFANTHMESTSSQQIQTPLDSNVENFLKIETETKVKANFPAEEIKADMENKDYEELYKQYIAWNGKIETINEKNLVVSIGELLKSEGVKNFYALGNQYVREQNNNKAIESLKKAQELGKSNDLYPHIIFSLGSAYERTGDYENALRLYEEYHKSFSRGDYAEEVLYKMVMIYKNVDKNKAKIYAEELINVYPKSIYNNTKTRAIIEDVSK